MKAFLTLQGIAILITFGAVVFFFAWIMGRCDQADQLEPDESGFVADTFETDDVEEFLPETDPGFIGRIGRTIRYRERPATKVGRVTNDDIKGQVNEYVRRAMAHADAETRGAVDSLRPVYPMFKVQTEEERGVTVGVTRSDAVYEVRAFPDCSHPCLVEAQDSTWTAREQRQVPGFSLLKDAAICAGAAGVGYGVAYAADYSHPEYIAAAMGGGCAVLRLVD